MASYISGNIVQFQVTFTTTATGSPVDPATVAFHYSLNGGASQDSITYASASVPAVGTIAKISTGVYETWVDTTGMSGVLTGFWTSTGAGAAAAEDIVTVGQTSATGYTFGDLIEKVYRRLMGGVRERTININQSGGISSTATTVILAGAQTASIVPGAILAIDLELLYVTAWTPGTLTANVERGYLGSLPATHANSTLVYINPRYSRYDIGVAINDDLRALSSPTNGLFRVGTATVTYQSIYQGYDLGDLPANFIDILEIRYKIAPPTRNFPPITKWKVLRSIPDAQFPSGKGIQLYQRGWPGLSVYIAYSAPFIPLVNLSDSLLNTPTVNDIAPPYNGYKSATAPNLYPEMVDIPPLGAVIDLTLPREVSRNFMESQPDPRKAQDVPATAVASSVNGVILRRNQRINEEADRLARQYRKVKGW